MKFKTYRGYIEFHEEPYGMRSTGWVPYHCNWFGFGEMMDHISQRSIASVPQSKITDPDRRQIAFRMHLCKNMREKFESWRANHQDQVAFQSRLLQLRYCGGYGRRADSIIVNATPEMIHDTSVSRYAIHYLARQEIKPGEAIAVWDPWGSLTRSGRRIAVMFPGNCNRELSSPDVCNAAGDYWLPRHGNEPISRWQYTVVAMFDSTSADRIIKKSDQFKEILVDVSGHTGGRMKFYETVMLLEMVAHGAGRRKSPVRVSRGDIMECIAWAQMYGDPKNVIVETPHFPGYTLLDTPLKIIDEGRRMKHCVGVYSNRVVDGNSILYHDDAQNSTIEIRHWRAGDYTFFENSLENTYGLGQAYGFANSSSDEIRTSAERLVNMIDQSIKNGEWFHNHSPSI